MRKSCGCRQVSPIDAAEKPGYTFGMKTAISLPEKVFHDAERFARRVRKSRSQLYAEAIAEYLARHSPDEITEMMNSVCDKLGSATDKFPQKASRRMLLSESW
jgi:predicted transcriptional regulator